MFVLLITGRLRFQPHCNFPDRRNNVDHGVSYSTIFPALGRTELFAHYLSQVKTKDEEVNAESLAKKTVGFLGAQIANMVNQAAIKAARDNAREFPVPFHLLILLRLTFRFSRPFLNLLFPCLRPTLPDCSPYLDE